MATPPAAPVADSAIIPTSSVTTAPVDRRDDWAAIRGSLRRLVLAEEMYFAENGTYTGNLQTLKFRPPSRAAVTLLWANRDGWAARGSYPSIQGKDCVVYVGRMHPAPATKRNRRQAAEGVPVCDEPSAPPPRAAPVARSKGAARAAPAGSAAADTGSALDAVGPVVRMKVDLRNLVRAQELWFATQGAYARRTELLAMQYVWHRGVTVRILRADRDSWSAVATHAQWPGKSCVIWSGIGVDSLLDGAPRTHGQDRQAVRPAIPVCDDPS